VLFGTRTYRKNEAAARKASYRILDLVGLGRVKDECAGNLSHGYQKMLGIARALAVNPKLLMLDEPLGGLNTDEIDFTMEILRKLKGEGVSILIIEHNMQVLDVCDHVVAINFGENVCSGCADEVRNDPDVIQCYLGEGDACSFV
jgi:branched-chain amino acid transport system ATP-binding protein